jgi:hypothetical protein
MASISHLKTKNIIRHLKITSFLTMPKRRLKLQWPAVKEIFSNRFEHMNF